MAPDCRVSTHDGRTLVAGEEVTLNHFRTIPESHDAAGSLVAEARQPWQQLEALVRNGAVLESYSVVEGGTERDDHRSA